MYYVRFADLLTDADLCEMSVPFSLDRRIIQPGSFSCSIDVANTSIGDQVAKIVPQRTIAHVYRNADIIGSYIIWTKDIEGAGGKVKCSLQGATLESYFYSRRLYSDLSYTNIEQITIATDLVNAAQTAMAPYSANADMGITVSSNISGVLRDRTYPASDGKYIGDTLEELANVDDGFEYIIHTIDNGTSRDRVMYMAYPFISSSVNPFVIEEPGHITSWKVSFDGKEGWNIFWSRGSVSDEDNTGPIMSNAYIASSFLENGFPVLDHVTDYSNVIEQTTLDKYSAWWAQNRAGPLFIPTFKVNAERMFESGFSSLMVGSPFVYILNNPAYPLVNGSPSLSGQNRMIGFELSVNESSVADMNILIETSFDPTEVV